MLDTDEKGVDVVTGNNVGSYVLSSLTFGDSNANVRLITVWKSNSRVSKCMVFMFRKSLMRIQLWDE